MKMLKPVLIKRVGKEGRELEVLLGLIDYYIQTGKPVGSNTLKERGFGHLSSATIRNYFAHLEEKGFLVQAHSSGGRIPTDLAFRLYGKTYLDEQAASQEEDRFGLLREFDSREVAFFLQEATELLSQITKCAAFSSAPRFDHDFIVDIKLIPLDTLRCLCVLITDFGVIRTEVLRLSVKLSSFAVKRIESYFQSRLKRIPLTESLQPEEEEIAQFFYNELMLRYLVGYSNFMDEDICRTGFSQLLNYPEFQEAGVFANGLSLFENIRSMRLLLKETKALGHLKFWVGDELTSYTGSSQNCSVIVVPYSINQKAVGAMGILGPTRIPYRFLFKTLRLFALEVSESLTKNIYKFKINFRQPESGKVYLAKEEQQLTGRSEMMLLT